MDSSIGLIFQFSPQLVFNLFDQHRLHFMFINLSKNRLEIFHFYCMLSNLQKRKFGETKVWKNKQMSRGKDGRKV